MNPASADNNNDMLLLVDGTLEHPAKANGSSQQFAQLAQTYEASQYVVQNNGNLLTADLENLNDLLNAQPITFGEGELSVIQRDGQHFLVLPNISVSHVLQTNEASAVQSINTGAQISYEQPELINVAPGESVSTPVQINNVDLSAVHSDDHAARSVSVVAASGEVQPAVLSQPDVVAAQLNNADPGPPAKMDMTRLVPSLFQAGTNGSQPKLQCLHCQYVANSEMEMDEHMSQHRNEITEQLFNKCKESFPKKQVKRSRRGRKKDSTCKIIRTTAPVSAESRKGPFVCEICNAEIPLISAFKRHMKEHQREKAHKCEECGETFNVESNLLLHRAIHAPPADDAHKCPACQRSFTRIASLKSHLTVHLVEETMICTECGDEFALQAELEAHMAEHQKDLQQHINDIAGTASLAQLGGQVVPNVINVVISDSEFHHGKKRRRRRKSKRKSPLKCQFCAKAFSKECLLKRHIMIHTGEKPFACDQCDKAFNQKSALQNHLMMHSGKKPYQCPHCPQIYVQRGNLRMHVARVHSMAGNTFRCMECSCVFKRLGILNAHMTKYHQQDESEQNQQSLLPLLTDDMMVPANQSREAIVAPANDSRDAVASTNQNEESRGGPKDDDVIQQLLRSLEDEDPSNVDALTAPSGDNLIDNDIVQQALQDSGVDSVVVAQNVSVPQDGGSGAEEQELMETPVRVPRRNDDYTSSMLNHTPPANEALPPPEQELPATTEAPVTPAAQPAPAAEKPRQFVISGLYMRNAGMSGDRSWKVRKVDGVRWHQCMYCQKEFKKPSDLVRHIRVHTQERPYKCPTCHKAFAVKTSLTQHAKTHLGYKSFRCQLCQKSFSTAGSLKVHIRRHTGARPFKCPQCDMAFRTSGHRRNHILSHMRGTARRMPNKPKKDIYPILTLPTTTTTPMQRPVLINAENPARTEAAASTGDDSSVRVHKCDACGKLFKKLSHLNQHLRTHTGEKPYSCTQCGKSFSNFSILKAHLALHTGTRPFQCRVCSQSFSTNHSLKRHMTTHRDERPFMCPYCQKTFKTSGTCTKHIATHRNQLTTVNQAAILTSPPTDNSALSVNGSEVLAVGGDENLVCMRQGGDKHFQCLVCCEAFADSQALKRHAALHRSDYACPYCPMTFKTGSECLKHLASHPTTVASNDQVPPLVDPASTDSSSHPNPGEDLDEDEDEEAVDESLYMKEQELLRRQQNARMSVGDLNFIHNGEAVEFEDDPTLQQVDPNMIQNIIKLPDFDVSTVVEQLTGEGRGGKAVPSLATDTAAPDFNTALPIDALSSFDVEESEVLKCSGCAKKFPTQEDQLNHFSTESSSDFQCPTCFHQLESSDSLESHVACHGDATPIACPLCHVYFSDEFVLDRHKQYHEKMQSPAIVDETCAAVGSAEDVLTPSAPPRGSLRPRAPRRKRHEFYLLSEEQSEILENTDPTQAMTLSERLLLKAVAEKDKVSVTQKPGQRGRHKEFEENGPIHPHACKFCPKSFRKPSDLKRHVRIHTGDKPFSCEVCGKSFAIKSTLVCHQRSHLQKKMFRCHICDMMYSAKSSLKVHMRLHTGAKPFTCPHCPATFRTSGHRKSHLITHMVNPYKPKDIEDLSPPPPSSQGAADAKPPPRVTTTAVISHATPSTVQQSSVSWPDVTLTVPVESFLNTNLFQDQDAAGIPLHLQGQNVGLSADDPNITLQIDPLLLQQTLQDSQNVSQQPQLFQQSSTQQAWPAPNVVIQPLNNLCPPSSLGNASSSGDSAAPSADEQSRPLQEINIAVPSSLANITQQALQCPVVLSTSGGGSDPNKGAQELTLNLNNPALLQAVQQLLSSVQASSATLSSGNRAQTQDGAVQSQDFTLTLSSADFNNTQGFLSISQLPVAGSDASQSENMVVDSAGEGAQDTAQMVDATSLAASDA